MHELDHQFLLDEKMQNGDLRTYGALLWACIVRNQTIDLFVALGNLDWIFKKVFLLVANYGSYYVNS